MKGMRTESVVGLSLQMSMFVTGSWYPVLGNLCTCVQAPVVCWLIKVFRAHASAQRLCAYDTKRSIVSPVKGQTQAQRTPRA